MAGFNWESRHWEQFTDWMLEFEAGAGVNDSGWETYKSDEVTLDAAGKKHNKALEMNSKAIHLNVASVKGVTCMNIINKDKQADSKFKTGKWCKVISEFESRFCPVWNKNAFDIEQNQVEKCKWESIADDWANWKAQD